MSTTCVGALYRKFYGKGDEISIFSNIAALAMTASVSLITGSMTPAIVARDRMPHGRIYGVSLATIAGAMFRLELMGQL